MTKKQNIVIVSPSFNIGGIERTLSIMANFFVEKGCDVTFISCLQGEIIFELDSRIKIVAPPFKRTGNVAKRAMYRVRVISFLRKEIKRIKPDSVLSMADTFNPLVILAALNLPTKVFVGDVTKPDKHFPLVTRMGKKYMYPKAAGFIAQTKSAEAFYRKQFNNKLNIRVINGSVKDVKLFDRERENLIINVGRISYEKGPDRLIEIFSRLKNKEGWKVGLTADGPMKKQLEDMVAEKGLQDQVIFLGKVKDLDVLYAQASVFVLPSRFEGFPNALCEAMAGGLPCISFDSFPVEEIITDKEDGFIIKDGDLDAFAQTLDMLIADKAERERVGKNAMAIRERLSIENICGQMLDFITTGK